MSQGGLFFCGKFSRELRMKNRLHSHSKFIELPYKRPTPSGSVLKEIIDRLRSVETDSPQAKLNETSISDNNGGRILL